MFFEGRTSVYLLRVRYGVDRPRFRRRCGSALRPAHAGDTSKSGATPRRHRRQNDASWSDGLMNGWGGYRQEFVFHGDGHLPEADLRLVSAD